MKNISSLTYKVVAYSEAKDFNTDTCIDWALEMMSIGYESPSLYILAGLNTPTNYFETIEYLKVDLNELNLKIKSGDEGVFSYSAYFIEQIAKNENVKENLQEVYEYSKSRDFENSIHDFYLLYWAWRDLDYGNEFQAYWEDATKKNIKDIVISTAKLWIKSYRKFYEQAIKN